MDVNSDQRFELHSFHLGQIFCGDVDQLVQNVQEKLVCLAHYLKGERMEKVGYNQLSIANTFQNFVEEFIINDEHL